MLRDRFWQEIDQTIGVARAENPQGLKVILDAQIPMDAGLPQVEPITQVAAALDRLGVPVAILAPKETIRQSVARLLTEVPVGSDC